MVMPVRRRAWIALGALALALLLGLLGRGLDVEPLSALSGLLWITALVLGVSLFSFWGRVLPDVAPMPGLFQPVPSGGRWCVHCGSSAQRAAACGVCGDLPPVKEPKKRRKDEP